MDFHKGDVVKLNDTFLNKKVGKFRINHKKKRGVFIKYDNSYQTLVKVQWFGFKKEITYHVKFIEKVQVG